MTDFKDILQPKVQKFIKTSEKNDIAELVLKGSPFNNVNIQQIAQQIKGRQTAKKKFPGLYRTSNIVYPPKLNLEQASSEATANYKANLIDGHSIVDITGGFGIDSIAFASKIEHSGYCELNSETFAYASHNFNVLGLNIQVHQKDGIAYLKQENKHLNWLYIDPSRRDENKNRVFWLESCSPNIVKHMNLFRSKADYMMVKTSPLLDINMCITQLREIYEVHVVAHKNDVKELLLLIDFKKSVSNPKIIAVNLKSNHEIFKTDFNKDTTKLDFSLPQDYLYEPNAAIMKTGMFASLCSAYNVKALADNSHLFTNNQLIEFPGRRFKIVSVIPPKLKLLRKHLKFNTANITTRNYPLKPQQIKAKYKLKDGGDNYLFFTTNLKNEKIVLICNKIK